MSSYRIADEPLPGRFAQLAVNPLFPFLAFMLGGLWIAWPWFAFNAIAVGSPTRRKEIAQLAGGLVLVVLVVSLLFALVSGGYLSGVAIAYAALAIPVTKIAVLYAVYLNQARTIEIYQYYGGQLKNGVIPIVVLILLRPRQLLESLPDFWLLVFG